MHMAQQGQQSPQDFSTMLYRLNALEQQVGQLHNQLQLYVPMRENELQLSAIKSTVERIENDVRSTKVQVGEMKDAQDKLQIRVLLGIVTTVATLFGSILVAYISHFF
jgi:conjugal transfer/entry exclusion protein